jgi:hypothetical protein
MDGTSREPLDQATRRERCIAAVIGAGIGLHEVYGPGLDDEEFRKELATQAALLAELRRSLKRR